MQGCGERGRLEDVQFKDGTNECAVTLAGRHVLAPSPLARGSSGDDKRQRGALAGMCRPTRYLILPPC